MGLRGPDPVKASRRGGRGSSGAGGTGVVVGGVLAEGVGGVVRWGVGGVVGGTDGVGVGVGTSCFDTTNRSLA